MSEEIKLDLTRAVTMATALAEKLGITPQRACAVRFHDGAVITLERNWRIRKRRWITCWRFSIADAP